MPPPVDDTADTERATEPPAPLAPHKLFPPERIVMGENPDGSLEVLVTDAGRAAAEAAGVPVDCDLCRVLFARGDEFFRATLGIDDAPDVVGAPPGAHNLIESRTEFVFCARCTRRVQPLLDGLLAQLWELRTPSREAEGNGPPTERVV
jgi:hypothetical protein